MEPIEPMEPVAPTEVGAYLRVSTPAQGREGTSLETQEERIRKAVEDANEILNAKMIWTDIASGATTKRKGLKKMRKAIRLGKVKKIYIYVTDRLTRDPIDTVVIIRECLEAGVELVFVEGPSDTSDEGQLMMFIMGYAAKRERLQFHERSMRGKQKIAQMGRMPDGKGPGMFGYDWDPILQKRVIKEPDATVVIRMFHWALEGKAGTRIAKMLNEENIPTRLGNKWSPIAVIRILQNPGYTGVQFYGTRKNERGPNGKLKVTFRPIEETIRVEGFTPPLITWETYTQVQEQLKRRKPRARNGSPSSLLTGLASCSKCGASIVGSMSISKTRYYRCNAATRKVNREPTCDARYIRSDYLEDRVWSMVSEAVRNPEILRQEMPEPSETSTESFDSEAKRLEREITGYKKEQRRLLELHQKDYIDQDILESQIGPVKLICDEKERLLSALKEQRDNQRDANLAHDRIAAYCRQIAHNLDESDFDGKRRLFAAFGVKVEASVDDLAVIMEVNEAITTKALTRWRW